MYYYRLSYFVVFVTQYIRTTRQNRKHTYITHTHVHTRAHTHKTHIERESEDERERRRGGGAEKDRGERKRETAVLKRRQPPHIYTHAQKYTRR